MPMQLGVWGRFFPRTVSWSRAPISSLAPWRALSIPATLGIFPMSQGWAFWQTLVCVPHEHPGTLAVPAGARALAGAAFAEEPLIND